MLVSQSTILLADDRTRKDFGGSRRDIASDYIKIPLWLYRNSRFLVLIIVLRNRTVVCDGAFKILLFIYMDVNELCAITETNSRGNSIQTP